MNGQTIGGLIPQVGKTEAESELGNQLNQLFSEISRTGELSALLTNRLHLVTKTSVPSPERPGQEKLMASLSPLADALRTKGIELMQFNDSINDLINRLAI